MRQAGLPPAIAVLAALTLAGWSGGAAALITMCNLPVSPPRTSAHKSLGPYDPPARACHPGYYCTGEPEAAAAHVQEKWKEIKSGGKTRARDGYYWLHQTAKDFLARAQKSDPLEFWGLKNMYLIPVTLDPPQGGSVSHSWRHCYTLAELDAARREAVRWAHYIMDVFLPQHFGRKFPDWLTGADIPNPTVPGGGDGDGDGGQLPDPFVPGSGGDGGGKSPDVSNGPTSGGAKSGKAAADDEGDFQIPDAFVPH